ncbi:hypothetical protein [Massilia phyllosphaerae]|uniref:hypothetical protein n=1 Tax=Massilia phyllosphaerae TaxID=3106034 RepID=UPI002B1CCB9A|nr:hypothetical protein [Massilia sp. SGZ-792]
MAKISVREFEQKVLEREEVVLIVRAAASETVYDYDYARKAAGTTSVSDWLEQRIKPCLEGKEFMIVSGDHSHPHGRTKLETLRNSYEK